MKNKLRSVRVTYSDGTVISTSMAAHLTDEQIKEYFKPGKQFNIGEGGKDKMAKVKSVEIMKTEKTLEQKIDEIKKGLSNPNIDPSTKAILEKALKNAESKLKPPTEKKTKSENSFKSLRTEDVFIGQVATGIVFADKTRNKNGDYATIAHVFNASDSASHEKILWHNPYTEKNIPEWLLAEIQNHLQKVKEKNKLHREAELLDKVKQQIFSINNFYEQEGREPKIEKADPYEWKLGVSLMNLRKLSGKNLEKMLPFDVYNLLSKKKEEPHKALLSILTTETKSIPHFFKDSEFEWIFEDEDENLVFKPEVIPFVIQNKKFVSILLKGLNIDLNANQIKDQVDEFLKMIYTRSSNNSSDYSIIVQNIYRGALHDAFIPISQRKNRIPLEIYKQIIETPIIRKGDGLAHLHYFSSSTDVWVMETDYGTGQQDFGIVDLFGEPELGYLSIKEIISTPMVELDFHFKPTPKEKILSIDIPAPAPTPAPKNPTYEVLTEKDSKHIGNALVRAIAQVFIDYGSEVEIDKISESIDYDKDLLTVKFELSKTYFGTASGISVEISVSLDDKYVITPVHFDCLAGVSMKEINSFVREKLDSSTDSRTKNDIYSIATFLGEESEKLVGKKVGVRTLNKLPDVEQDKLRTAYKKKVDENTLSRRESKTSETPKSKIRLTKFLKQNGVTQQMIDEINKTKQGVELYSIVIKGKETKHDKKRSALTAGKRLSRNGNIYYEYRIDRADN